MNTEEAIEFMESEVNYMTYAAFKCPDSVFEAQIFERKRKGVIELLGENGKYKQMQEEFIWGLAHINIGNYRNPCDEELSDLTYINILMKDLKRKYFPDKKEEEAINEMEKMTREGQAVIKELTDVLLFVKRKWDLKDK